jgi:hypothetical protein
LGRRLTSKELYDGTDGETQCFRRSPFRSMLLTWKVDYAIRFARYTRDRDAGLRSCKTHLKRRSMSCALSLTAKWDAFELGLHEA